MAQTTREEPDRRTDLAPDLERSGDVPLAIDLGWRLRTLIRSGRLGAGERLPGVRELATGAGVNVNTARSVYRSLEVDGLISSRQGSGTFVADGAAVWPALEELAAEVAEEARARGVEPRELARAIYVGSSANYTAPASWEEPDHTPEPPPVDPGEETAEQARGARRTLRGQIARLEAELAAYPEHSDPDADTRFEPLPKLADLDDLERLRDELVERLKLARATVERQGKRQEGARAHLDAMIAAPAEHRFETVANEDLGDPGCSRWEVRPAWGPVGALMNWWRVKISSGCP